MNVLRLVLLTVLSCCSGCAIFNRENTRVLNWFEAKVVPKENPARILSYPALIPAGIVVLAVDGIVVHPIASVDDALRDTEDICWKRFDWETGYVTECAKLPLRTVGTPIICVGSFVLRSLFDISPNEPVAATQQPEPEPEPRRYHDSFVKSFFASQAGAEIYLKALTLEDRPRWLARGKAAENEMLAALKEDSWAVTGTEGDPGRALCWIVLHGREAVALINLREQGLFVTIGTHLAQHRIENESLAELLRAAAEREGLLDGEDGDAWRRALQNAAHPETAEGKADGAAGG